MLEVTQTKPEIKEIQKYVGQLRVPSREEADEIKKIANKTPLQLAQYKMYHWHRDHICKAQMSRFFNFSPMADMKDRFDWEVMYNIFLEVGKKNGWVRDGKPTPFDYEQDVIDRNKKVYVPAG